MRPFRRAGLIIVACTLAASAVSAAPERSWHLQNIFSCTTSGSHMTCGPHLQMTEGEANGTFPSGVILVRDGETRMWIAAASAAEATTFGTRAWSIRLGGTSVVTRARWIVGSYDASTQTFTPAPGAATSITSTDASTFVPTDTFSVPAGHHVALRITGTGGPTIVDVYDEFGGPSPSTLVLAQ